MKLSTFLKSPTPLTEEDLHCILYELAIRQETVERVMASRLNVLLAGLGGICTCSWSLDVKEGSHLSVCPSARMSEDDPEKAAPHDEEVKDKTATVTGDLSRAQLMNSLYRMKSILDSTDHEDVPDADARKAMMDSDALNLAIKLAEAHYNND